MKLFARLVPSLVAAAVLAALSPLAVAQDWAKAALEKSPRHREYVAVTHDGRTVNTLVVYPEVSGKAPVVILIHEIFGLSDWMKLEADELAAKGYIVMAPDLLSGLGPVAKAASPMPMAAGQEMDHTHMAASPGAAYVAALPGGTAAFPDQDAVVKAVSSLDAAQVTADLDAVADFGKKIPAANGNLAVGGFCWGGGKTFAFATHRHDLGIALVFYGPPPPAAAMAAITAPVYGFYAGLDARIGATVPGAIADMTAAGKTYEPVTYDGAGHGFMRAGQAPDATLGNKKAWEEGFARMTDLLAKLK
jgi:carboxymethylenebutenolidase